MPTEEECLERIKKAREEVLQKFKDLLSSNYTRYLSDMRDDPSMDPSYVQEVIDEVENADT